MWRGEITGRLWALPELRHGHIPMWNPMAMSGMPFFTKSQVPILYPFEWLTFVLPVATAINVNMAIHVFLAGLWMYLWARHRGLTALAATMAGAILMFSGPVILHLYAGHVNSITAMSWAPLMFLAVDLIVEGQYRNGLLLGIFSLGMQVFASQPQYTFFCLIVLFLYAAARFRRMARPMASVGFLALAALWGLAMGALVLVPAALQSQESTRVHGTMSESYAQSYSFPPIGMATSVMPTFFGTDFRNYWGSYNICEASVFVGFFALLLAFVGMFLSRHPDRKPLAAVMLATVILALGKHIPIYGLLYHIVPCYSLVRGTGQFVYETCVLLALLAGAGLDAVPADIRVPRILAAVAMVACGCLLVLWAGVGTAQHHLHWIVSFLAHVHSHIPDTPQAASQFAAIDIPMSLAALLIAALTCGVLAVVSLLVSRKPELRWLLAVGCLVEVFCFAYHFKTSFSVARLLASVPAQYLVHANADDGRIALEPNPNVAMAIGVSNVDGYDAMQLKRYAEFVTYSQGANPNDFDALTMTTVQRPDPLLRLLRLRRIVNPRKHKLVPVSGALPHVFLADEATIAPTRDAEFADMEASTFRPDRQVIVESRLNPMPEKGTTVPGTAVVTGSGTGYLDIQADAIRPAILVVTDAYSSNWHATARGGRDHRVYDVVPVDYTLRGIPLSTGHHDIHLAYDAPGWRLSEITTLAALFGYGILCLTSLRRRRPIA